MMKIRIELDPESLRGTNAAVDLEQSWSRYRAELQAALRREFPEADVVVERGPSTRVEGVDAETKLRVEGLARAVRHCANWVVYEE